MIAALTLLLVIQLAGEVIARALGLPIPGPVIGMGLLFLALLVRRGPGEDLRRTSGQLLQHLSLLFVPAGTGIVVIGDSHAMGWGANDEETFAAQLQALSGRPVYNLGVASYGTAR
ncbi:MAG: CidA/LrgA family protein, partial [Gammaproteobacteria bacterium]